MKHVLAALAGLLLAAGAAAHDSWLAPARDPGRSGPVRLELSTGNRYPVSEFNPSSDSLLRSQCTDGEGSPLSLLAGRDQPQWLELAVLPRGGRPVLACWIEMKAYELDMDLDKVPLYFAEVRANEAQRATWAALQARGLRWLESYRKFARIELPLPAGVPPERIARARQPVGLDLEIVVQGTEPIAVGRPLSFQVLRDGKPLAGLPVELVSERSALGIWRESDAQGAVRHTLPLTGRWLVRAIDLRLDEADATRWRSRFVTLAIEAR